MRKSKIIKNCKILFFTMFCLLLAGCKSNESIDSSFFALDTMVSIRVYDYNNKQQALSYLEKCKSEIERYENKFSKTIEDSMVYKYNNRDKKKYKDIDAFLINNNDQELEDIVSGADNFSGNISSLFDIYMGDLVDIWDKAKEGKTLPDNNSIMKALSLRDDEKSMDLGACAKGYIADRLKDMAISYDVKSCIINLGGNVYAVGNKHGEPFRIGINKPFDDGDIIDKIEVEDKTVVTSGIYQRYFTIDGDDTIYHHILDKRTGYPSTSDIISASIVCDNSFIADMLATACVIVGIDDSKVLIDKAKEFYDMDIQSILIDKDMNIIRY